MVAHEIKFNKDKLFALVGNSIKAVSQKDGKQVASFTPSHGYLHSLQLYDQHILAIGSENKEVYVLDIDSLDLISVRSLPKKPVSLDQNDGTIIVGDKFGDVYSIPLLSTEPVVGKDSSSQSLIDPILGHVSMLTAVKFINHNDRTYAVTADRDEHIRISRFPQAYVIERFLFGHTEFVSAVQTVPWDSSLLLSAGGDDFVALWDWTTGQLLDKFDLRPVISPHLDQSHDSIRDKAANPREVTVSRVECLQEPNVAILCEGTKALIGLSISKDKKLVLEPVLQQYQPESKIVDIAFDGKWLHASLESSVVDRIDGGQETCAALDQAIFADQGNTPPLYNVKQLRKRGEY